MRAALCLMIVCLALTAPACAEKPVLYNYVVILTDDQGWGTTSMVYDPAVAESASDFFETPHLARLAERGMRFTQAYAAHPNCSPTRAALQTGKSPAALHLTDIVERHRGPLYEGNRLIPPTHISGLPASEQTIAELLKAKHPQYRAAHFGKWHLGAGGPEKHGYDASDGNVGNGPGYRKTNLPDDPKLAFSMTRSANDWMTAQVEEGRPFYLQVSHYATHLPYQSRPATERRFRNKAPGERHQNVAFAAMIADMDEAIGQLIAHIDELGIGDRTYIIYTADNGTFPTNDAGNINGPLRGSKATVWEAGVRVPFVVVGPGVAKGSVSRQPVITMDVLPTICELAGIDAVPAGVEGGSVVGVIESKPGAEVERVRDVFVFHWPHYQHQKKSKPDTTLIDLATNHKLHYWWETGTVQLFDLKTDLAESRDLAATQPRRAAQLKAKLHDYLRDVDARLPEPNPDFDPAKDPALKHK